MIGGRLIPGQRQISNVAKQTPEQTTNCPTSLALNPAKASLPSFRNGPMINVPPVAAEAEVREEGVNRFGPVADIDRLKALHIG